jgi:hypothetical protein
MNAFRKIVLIVLVIGILDLSVSSFVYGSTNLGIMVSQTGTGTVVAARYSPEVTGMRIGRNLTQVSANGTYDWVVLLADKNSLKNLASVTIFVHASNGLRGVFDEERSYGFQWLTGGTWQELTPTGWSNSTTYLNATQSSHTAASFTAGSGEWHFSARLSEKALKSNSSGWFFDSLVRDKVGAEGQMSIKFEIDLSNSATQNGVQTNMPLTAQPAGYMKLPRI